MAKGFRYGVLLGGLIGGAAALLLAPGSGKKTRKKLSKSYSRLSREAKGLVESACDTSIDLAERAQEIAECAEAAAKKCKKRMK